MYGMSAKDRLAMFEKKTDTKKPAPTKKIGKLNTTKTNNNTEDKSKAPGKELKSKDKPEEKPVAKKEPEKASGPNKVMDKKEEPKESKAPGEKKKDEKPAKVEEKKTETKPETKTPASKAVDQPKEEAKPADKPAEKAVPGKPAEKAVPGKPAAPAEKTAPGKPATPAEKPAEKAVPGKPAVPAEKPAEKTAPGKPAAPADKPAEKAAPGKPAEKPAEKVVPGKPAAPAEKAAPGKPATPAEKPAEKVVPGKPATPADKPAEKVVPGKPATPADKPAEKVVPGKPATPADKPAEKAVPGKPAEKVAEKAEPGKPAAPAEKPAEKVAPGKPATPAEKPAETPQPAKAAEQTASQKSQPEKSTTVAAPAPAVQGKAPAALEHTDVAATDVVMTVVHEKVKTVTEAVKKEETPAGTAEKPAVKAEGQVQAGEQKVQEQEKVSQVPVQEVKEVPPPKPPVKREPEYKPIPEEFYDNLFYFSGMGTLVGTALSKGVYVPPRATRTALEVEMIENYESLKDEERKMDVHTIKKARGQAVDLAEELRKLQILLGGLPSFGDSSSGHGAGAGGQQHPNQVPPYVPFTPLGPPRRLEPPKGPNPDQTSPKQSGLNLIAQSAKTVAESTPTAPKPAPPPSHPAPAPVQTAIMNGPPLGVDEAVRPERRVDARHAPPAPAPQPPPAGGVPGSSVGVFKGPDASQGSNVPWQARYGQGSVEDAQAPRPFESGGAIPGGLKPWQLSHLRGLEVRGYEFSHERPMSGADYSDSFYHGSTSIGQEQGDGDQDTTSLAPFLVSNRSQSVDREKLLRSHVAVTGTTFRAGHSTDNLPYHDV